MTMLSARGQTINGVDAVIEFVEKDICRLAPAQQESKHYRLRNAGLENNGRNICFANAVIQCMMHASELAIEFLPGSRTQHLNADSTSLAKQFSIAVTKMYSDTVMNPTACYNLDNLKQAIDGHAKRFDDTDHHDAEEFLTAFLEFTHQELNTGNGCETVVEHGDGNNSQLSADMMFGRLQAQNSSIITDLFHGLSKSMTTCKECNFQSVKFDQFSNIQLSFEDSSKPVDLGKMLANYLAVETLGQDYLIK